MRGYSREHVFGLLVLGWSLFCGNSSNGVAAEEPSASRTNRGLQVLYDFRSVEGDLIRDVSGSQEPIALKIRDRKAVKLGEGSLEIRENTLIQSVKPATRLSKAVRESGALTIEVWLQPADLNLEGPARIVTLSKNPNERNFTLGQEKQQYDVRLRTTRTSTNGIPSIPSPGKSLSPKVTHLVYTHSKTGRTRIFLNGEQVAEQAVPGETSNWDSSFHLGLANELSLDRPWRGTLHLVAIYNQELVPKEVRENFLAGVSAKTEIASATSNSGERLFADRIAPILAHHCLECHDPGTRKGGLDLSRKQFALNGGESGKAIVPGKPQESLLWNYVESNEMPAQRDPLSAEEKQALKEWITLGAPWSFETIDPVIYRHGRRSAQPWIQRLTVAEYIETVRSAVGVDIEKEARELLPPDLRADGFSNTAYNLNVDLKHVEAYVQLAEIIVSRMDVEAFASRFSKSRKLEDDEMEKLIVPMGKWILRGPLQPQEIRVFRGISSSVAGAGGTYQEAVALLLEAMLQSPRFLYRIEAQQGEKRPVGDFELASRMSYILWGGPPDEELLQAAERGELNPAQLEKQIQRMLQDPRALKRSQQFLKEWLNLNHLNNLQPNAALYPDWSPELAADMQRETLAFWEEIVWNQNRPLTDLLQAKVSFLTPRLARHYGLEPHQGQREDELARYDLSEVPVRGGLLTQGSVLTIGGDEASMVTRGLFIFHELLRGVVKDPPPCVDTTPVPTQPGLTQRGIALQRIKSVNCAGCHSKFEPVAFGLEKFDGLGAFLEKDHHGNPLRDDGELFVPGTEQPVAFQNSSELMKMLANSERVKETFTWKVTQFALGRPLVPADLPALNQIHQSSQKAGGNYRSLITAIVLSDLVQMTQPGETP